VPGQKNIKIKNIYAEYYTLAQTYYQLENYDKAIEYYKLSMRKKEQYWASYYQLAKCYAFISDWDNALSMYKKILERDEENASIKASIAYIYSMQGQYKKAAEIYEELLQEQSDNKDYLENYLAVLISDEKNLQKNSEKFIEYLEILKNGYPDNNNIKILQEKYNTLMGIEEEAVEEDSEEIDSENDNNDEINNASK